MSRWSLLAGLLFRHDVLYFRGSMNGIIYKGYKGFEGSLRRLLHVEGVEGVGAIHTYTHGHVFGHGERID